MFLRPTLTRMHRYFFPFDQVKSWAAEPDAALSNYLTINYDEFSVSFPKTKRCTKDAF